MAIDWPAIERAGFEAAVGAVGRGLQRIESRAKELAPVRKIFGQFAEPYRTRLKTVSEIEADRGIRKQLGLGPENAYVNPPSIVSRRARQSLGKRRLGPTTDIYTGRRLAPSLSRVGAERDLDRRGRYELRSTTRSHHDGSVGGRLRSEIYSTPVEVDGKMIRGRVVSPTRYAKYQEFGTRHNPAHPYMRPAAHESRDGIKTDVGRSVATAVKPLFRGRIDVVIKTRVR